MHIYICCEIQEYYLPTYLNTFNKNEIFLFIANYKSSYKYIRVILPQRIKKDQFLILSVLEFCISCVMRQYMPVFLSFLKLFILYWNIAY